MSTPEGNIQTAICDYLERKKYFFWRQNTAPTVSRNPNGDLFFRKMAKYAMKGVPDIIVIGDGGFVIFLEVKTKEGKLSEDQKKFQARAKEAGAEYHVVRSIDEAMKIL